MTAVATFPVWVANDIGASLGTLRLRCRARCSICEWRGPVRHGNVPDSLRPSESHQGKTAATDALRHAERVHDWSPSDVESV